MVWMFVGIGAAVIAVFTYALIVAAGQEERTRENVDRCVCCGEIVPEGRMICGKCEQNMMSEGDG